MGRPGIIELWKGVLLVVVLGCFALLAGLDFVLAVLEHFGIDVEYSFFRQVVDVVARAFELAEHACYLKAQFYAVGVLAGIFGKNVDCVAV